MPNSKKKYLIIVAGPTAVGKTDLSIQLAKVFRTEIISADSRQFFRELNIGTAKPSQMELAEVQHHFINSHSITENYSAGDFERDTLKLLDVLFQTHDCVLMTGGSGFYIKAVLEGLDDLPAPLPGLRDYLTKKLSESGLPLLQEEIRALDQQFAETQEIFNPQRVLRALEVYYTTGTPISKYQVRETRRRSFDEIGIALDRERAELYSRIDERMDMMLNEGLVNEAKELIQFRSHHALQTVGYKEVYGFLDGLYDEGEMVRLLKQNSRRYAKRQLTWFRHQSNFKWFNAVDFTQILEYIYSKIGNSI
ncbi:tRNA (adenosine(37)-N6)-dimethylallyltransferase MiaA [Dyadobacter arcticus]|uniref:tRNA dimethylallyltransferase n=1 Tax=Dyadobacter arcticus TaxID=1078754 RepID=A0ABX0UKE7_9BACT|nr:tRNA (adenosine(37)-N6)-dimethylallyltransferase MiaA [Dyadobacter arcticus]NIJ53491.1 tRNA dimethylallyltransferase [Dyadobacter arcticus]